MESGQVTCKLLNHYFLESSDGVEFTWEITITTGLMAYSTSERFHRFSLGPPTSLRSQHFNLNFSF
jgi:hypothetical protein